MIKSAAENIYPAEVEACVATHPAVAECAVIGVPDAQVDAEREGDRRAQPGRDADRRGDHRALPRPHRVVQEAAQRRVRREAAARRLRGRLRRARRAVRRRRLPGREEPERVQRRGRAGRPHRRSRRPVPAPDPTGRRRATASSRAGSRTTSIISRSRCVTTARVTARRVTVPPVAVDHVSGRRPEPASARGHAAVDAAAPRSPRSPIRA